MPDDQARAGRGRALLVLAIVVGLALMAGSGIAIWRGQGVSEVGADSAERLSIPLPTEPPAAAASDVQIVDGREPPGSTTRTPVALTIPSIEVTAQIDQVGVTPETRALEVPPSVDRVGWYRHGPGLEATAGSIVIAGHVDSAEHGKGAFFRLGELTPGDLVEVRDDDGAELTFEVVARQVFDKQELPAQTLFARDGAPRLTLITCGGEFDRDTRSYQDNVVVTAVPAD